MISDNQLVVNFAIFTDYRYNSLFIAYIFIVFYFVTKGRLPVIDEQNTPQEEVLEETETTENSETPEKTEDELAQEKARADLIAKLEELAREGKTLLPFFPPHPGNTKQALDQIIDRLEVLKEKVGSRQESVEKQNGEIKERLTALAADETLGISADFEKSDAGIKNYTDLLAQIIKEIEYERESLVALRDLEKATYITINLGEPVNFEAYVNYKIGLVNKQTKKVDKDINVSFSRYQFSFENQIKRITHLEFVQKAIQKHKK